MHKRNYILAWFTPGDLVLIALLLLLSGLSFWINRATTLEGSWAVIHLQGDEIARLPLNKNRRFEVTGPLGKTNISIQDGQVKIESSACPHKLCTQMGPASRTGELLVCVPNLVVVQVVGHRNSFDFITE